MSRSAIFLGGPAEIKFCREMGLARGVALAFAALALAMHPESAAWSCAQLVHALWPFRSTGARLLEQWAWARWEAGASEQLSEPLVEMSLRVEETARGEQSRRKMR